MVRKRRRRVFISYAQSDRAEVEQFVRDFTGRGGAFTPRELQISHDSATILSRNPDYVMTRIRRNYIADASVTILLLGHCTHSRRYVDWELKDTLRRGNFRPTGLLGIILPSAASGEVYLPPRFALNWNAGDSKLYARLYDYPSSKDELRSWIADAYQARSSRAAKIRNPSEMMRYNRRCQVHGRTH